MVQIKRGSQEKGKATNAFNEKTRPFDHSRFREQSQNVPICKFPILFPIYPTYFHISTFMN